MFEIVVVVLECGLGVVRRVDEDALHLSRVVGQQCFQCFQVVALYQHVRRILVAVGKALHGLQKAIRRLGRRLQVFASIVPFQPRHPRLPCAVQGQRTCGWPEKSRGTLTWRRISA